MLQKAEIVDMPQTQVTISGRPGLLCPSLLDHLHHCTAREVHLCQSQPPRSPLPASPLWNLITTPSAGEAGQPAPTLMTAPRVSNYNKEGRSQDSLFLKTKLTLIPFDTVYVHIAGKARLTGQEIWGFNPNSTSLLSFWVNHSTFLPRSEFHSVLREGVVTGTIRSGEQIGFMSPANLNWLVASYQEAFWDHWKRMPWSISDVCHRIKNRKWQYMCYLFTVLGLDDRQHTANGKHSANHSVFMHLTTLLLPTPSPSVTVLPSTYYT